MNSESVKRDEHILAYRHSTSNLYLHLLNSNHRYAALCATGPIKFNRYYQFMPVSYNSGKSRTWAVTPTHIHTWVETFSFCPPALLKFTCITTSGTINTLQSSHDQLLRIKLTDNWDQMASNDMTRSSEEENLPV